MIDFSSTIVDELRGVGLDPLDVSRVVDRALDEDFRYGPDVTTDATVPESARATGSIVARHAGVVAGIPIALAVFERLAGRDLEIIDRVPDATAVAENAAVLTVRARTRALLTAERTALNLVCHLSGIATATARWVSEVAGTGCVIRDTRKTLPGLRGVQKYAVRAGGGANHRMALGDAVLIKDNHVRAAGSVTAALRAVREHAPDLPCEVEIDSLAQLDELLPARPTLILLDNFTPEECAEAVRRCAGSGVELEASGGLTMQVARAYAETGVRYLAVGALTHSSVALDLGLDLT